LRVRTGRIVSATAALAATLGGALWLYTYRIWTVVEYIDPTGQHFHASERVRESPWWSAPASVVLMFLGSAVVLWLLPGQRTLIRRFTEQFAKGNKIVVD
jgi:hypothetical protein